MSVDSNVKNQDSVKTILIVDDEEPILQLYSQLFNYMNVFTATGGFEAVDFLKKNKVDIVLTDINMPDGDGLLVLKEAKSQDIPIVVISSTNDRSALMSISNEKPYYCFDKFDPVDKISQTVNNAIQEKLEKIENKFYESLGKNASKVIHDLTNPLSLILGNNEIIRININKPEVINKSLDSIEGSVDKITSIIRRTKLEFVQNMESGGNSSGENSQEEYLAPESIITFLTNFRKEQEVILTKNKVKMVIDIPHKKDHLVLINELDLNRVFSNLVENSIYEFERTNQSHRMITMSLFDKKGCVVISFKDNGPGISKEIKSKLFIDRISTKPKGEGSGIGLDSCKAIVIKHKGSIQVSSQENGAEFLIAFPIAPANVGINKQAA